jgi:hypothetical protein
MTILTDGVHLISDQSAEELHRFAQGIGLKREWFQRDHYDLMSDRTARAATRAGARIVSTRAIVLLARRTRTVL